MKTVFWPCFRHIVELEDFVSTYPLRKLIHDATMAFVCFLLAPGAQIIYIFGGGKKISAEENFLWEKNFWKKKIFANSSIYCLW